MTTRISILGAGESGVGAAILAKKLGYDVFVSDFGQIQEPYRAKLEKHQIRYEEGQHSTAEIMTSKEVVKSPGISEKATIIQQITTAGIPVIDEIEFAYKNMGSNSKIIAITGSNGKTTTTLLTHHLLKTAGYDVGLGGNVGFSFAELVAKQEHTHYVLELSSFQLDYIQTFQPNISIILNITPDHLDRYEHKLENYAISKLRIMMNQTQADTFIMNSEDKNIAAALGEQEIRPKCVSIGQVHHKEDTLKVGTSVFDTSHFSLAGEHNMFNATCAIQAALQLGVSPLKIQEGLDTFVNAAHRMEHIATINDILYINDSKATNVDAVYYALDAMTRPVIWVVGGKDKGNDYSPLFPLVQDKVKAIICLGENNEKLLETFSSQVKIIEETSSAAEAVQRANIYAEAGDVVLLSPACASFDLFKNYEERGNLFKKAVETVSSY